jgi:hypothetical protein
MTVYVREINAADPKDVAHAVVGSVRAIGTKLTASAVAPVTPSRASVLGDAPPAQHRPSARVLRREAVAKNRPAPTPPSFAAMEQEFAKQPGRPLEVNAAAGAAAAAARTEERRVSVVTASHPPEAAPKGSDRTGKSKAVEPRWNAPLGGQFAPQQTTGQQQEQRAQQQDEQRAKQAARQQPHEQQRQERGKKDESKDKDGQSTI